MTKAISLATVLFILFFTVDPFTRLSANQAPNPTPPIAISADGRLIAKGDGNAVSISDAQTEKVLIKYLGHTAPVFALAFAPDGKLLAVGSQDKTCSIFEVTSGRQTLNFKMDSPVITLSFSQDGKMLTSVEMNMTIRVWEIATGKLLQETKKK